MTFISPKPLHHEKHPIHLLPSSLSTVQIHFVCRTPPLPENMRRMSLAILHRIPYFGPHLNFTEGFSLMIRVILVLSCVLWVMGCVPQKPEKKQTQKAPMDSPMGERPENPHGKMNTGPGLDLTTFMSDLPEGWTKTTPASSMRLGQAALARAQGDTMDAELAIFHFPGTGGSAAANLERWEGQMEGPNGEPGASVARKDTMKLDNGIRVITVDITGTQLPSGMGMGPTSAMPNSRMIASVLETPAGNYFVKVTGPKNTVAAHEAKLRAFLKRAKLGGDA